MRCARRAGHPIPPMNRAPLFPEDTQKHAMVYDGSTIQTLNEGVRILHRVSNPILCYRQHISLRYPMMDRAYEDHIQHNESEGLFYVSFPQECTYLARFHTHPPCKMVTYYRDPAAGTIREIRMDSTTNLKNGPAVQLLVYTRHQKDLILSYDVYLTKPALNSHL
jgi:hypothetical protein